MRDLATAIANKRWAPYAVLAGIALLYSFQFLKLQDDYWFEDDTYHLYYVQQNTNPLNYFTPDGLKEFSFGRTVTPMLPLSYWVDQRLAPLSTQVAYIHTGLMVMLTSLLMFQVLTHIMSRSHALAAAALWPFLPSSIAVIEFIAARHYLEGLTLTLLGLLAAFRAMRSDSKTYHWTLLATLCYFLAACCKEIHVTTGYAVIASVFLAHRQWKALVLSGLGPLAYLAYRLTAIGGAGKGFDDPFAFLPKYDLFIERIPHIFAGHQLGYLLFGLFVPVIAALLIRRRISIWAALFFAGNLVLLLATVFPVTEHLTMQYERLGTWHRVAFLYNIFLLVCGTWMISQLKRPSLRYPVFAAALLAVGLGAGEASRRWDVSKEAYRADAEFYLTNPDKLLYSKLPATWFMRGLVWLHEGKNSAPHYIAWRMMTSEVMPRLNQSDTVWVRGEDGIYVSDPALYRRIWENASNEITPLHKPIEDNDLQRRPMPGSDMGLAADFVYDSGLLSSRKGGVDHVTGPAATELTLFLSPNPPAIAALLLANDGQEGAALRVTAFSPEGVVLGQVERHLSPRTYLLRSLDGLFLTRDTFSDGYLSIRSNTPILATHMSLGSKPVFENATPAQPQHAEWFPHSPGNKKAWDFELLFANNSDQSGEIQLKLWFEDGGSKERMLHIPARGSLVFDPREEEGLAAIRYQADGVIARMRLHSLYEQKTVVANPAVADLQHLQIPAGESGQRRGLAVFNPHGAPCRISRFDDKGVIRNSRIIPPHTRLLIDLDPVGQEVGGPITFQTELPVAAAMVTNGPHHLGFRPLERETRFVQEDY